MNARHGPNELAEWDQVPGRDGARLAAGLLLRGIDCLEDARKVAARDPDILRIVEAFARTRSAADVVLALDVPGDDTDAHLALNCLRYANRHMGQAMQRGRLQLQLDRAQEAIANEQRQARRALQASEAHCRAKAASVRAVAALRFPGEP
jgi:hypothetical protein